MTIPMDRGFENVLIMEKGIGESHLGDGCEWLTMS